MINAAVSHWMATRGRSWKRTAGELVTMLVVNLVIVLVLEFLDRVLGVRDARTPFVQTLFFSYLLTLIIVLYDRYRVVYKARRLHKHPEQQKAAPAEPGHGRAGGVAGPGLTTARRRAEPARARDATRQRRPGRTALTRRASP